ncbi:MAG: hypothetical protein ACXWNG_00200 [Candidatus Limnocylindrales bacterium]
MDTADEPLEGRVALVAWATRGAGRDLVDIFEFRDLAGSRPHWGSYFERAVRPTLG